MLALSCPRLLRPLGAGVSFALLLAASAGASAASYRVVAYTGQAAPGGGTFNDFGFPRISQNGRVAFTATLLTKLGPSGVWSEGVSGMQNLEVVIRGGNVVPGFPDTFFGTIDPGDIGVRMNAGGAVAVAAPIFGAQAAFGSHVIVRHDQSGLNVLAAPGTLVTIPGAGFGSRTLTNIGTFPSFNASGEVAFIAEITGTGVNASNDTAIFRTSNGQRQLVLREGDVPPATFGVTFGSWALSDRIGFNDNGVVLKSANLDQNGTNDTFWSMWQGVPGAMTMIAAEGWASPEGPDFLGSILLSLTHPLITNSGRAQFRSAVDNPDLDVGIWQYEGGALTTIAFPGQPVLDGSTISELGLFTATQMNDAGEAIFEATTTDPVRGGFFDDSLALIRRNVDGTHSVIIREGDDAPGVPLAVTIADPLFDSAALLDDGSVIFSAILEGQGVGPNNNEAIYITRDGQDPELLIREGISLLVGGQLRILSDIVWLHESGAESGGRIAANSLGQAVIRAEFLDGTQAIIVVSPDPACPGDANDDGVVDFGDLNIVLGAFGNTGDIVPGDFNLDGDVDFNDLNQVLTNFGEFCPQ
jgi:hypothetical protein